MARHSACTEQTYRTVNRGIKPVIGVVSQLRHVQVFRGNKERPSRKSTGEKRRPEVGKMRSNGLGELGRGVCGFNSQSEIRTHAKCKCEAARLLLVNFFLFPLLT